MKKQKKTYGVIGMMEFQAVIKVGRNTMKIPFSDGSLSALGNNPAKFTTDNFMVQHAIENSSEFKRGLIRLLNTVDLPGEVKVLRNGPKALNDPIPIEIKADGSQIPASGTANPASNADAGETPEPTEGEEIADEASTEVANEPASGTANPASEPKQIEVHCKDDAKDYLEQNFGVVKSKLRNKETIASVAATYGIEFVYV